MIDGNFEDLGFAQDSTFEYAWSQDEILHSSHKEKIFQEVFRVMKDGGTFIFTDPMECDGVDRHKL